MIAKSRTSLRRWEMPVFQNASHGCHREHLNKQYALCNGTPLRFPPLQHRFLATSQLFWPQNRLQTAPQIHPLLNNASIPPSSISPSTISLTSLNSSSSYSRPNSTISAPRPSRTRRPKNILATFKRDVTQF